MRRSIVFMLMLFVLVALNGILAVAQEDTAQANKDAVYAAVAEYNAGNYEAFYGLMTNPFMMNQGDTTLVEMMPEDVLGFDQALVAAMPDLQMSIEVAIAQGEWVALRTVFSGTFTQPYSFIAFGSDSFPPTNEVVSWTETNFLHFNADGLVSELWIVSNSSVLFGHLGIFPPMEEDPATLLELPAGYQILTADELVATYTSGMEDRNVALFQNQIGLGLGMDDSDYYADTYISWNNVTAVSYVADIQVEEDMAFTGMIATAMPDYAIETPVVVAEGDWVATLVNLSGTFTDDTDFFGMPFRCGAPPAISYCRCAPSNSQLPTLVFCSRRCSSTTTSCSS